MAGTNPTAAGGSFIQKYSDILVALAIVTIVIMMQAVRRQMPLLAAYPHTISAKCVRAIANNLLYGGKVRVKRGWMGFLQRFIDFSG